MNDLQNLLDTVDILTKQEEMLDILEEQQSEIETLTRENESLKEQVDELTSLNETLAKQTKTYGAALKKSNEQIETVKQQIKDLSNYSN